METMKKGNTSNSIYFHLRDSSDGTSKTGLVYNSAGAVASYVRAGAARTAITLATLASASAAYSSGGFILVDDTNAKGLYRLDIPNAAVVTGVDRVIIHIGFTGIFEESLGIQLVDNTEKDSYDIVNNSTYGNAKLVRSTTPENPLGVDANNRIDVGSWLGTAVTTSGTSNKPEVDVNSISDDATAANNLELDYDGTGYEKANSEIGTVATLISDAGITQAGADKVWGTAARGLTDKAGFSLAADQSAVTVGTVTDVANDVGITQGGADKVWGTAARALTDKAGFALSAAGVQAIWDALTSALTTASSIGKLLVDNIDAAISGASTHAAADIWSVGTRDLTDKAGFSLAADQSAVTVGTVNSATVDTNNDKTGYAISGALNTLDDLENISAANVNSEVADVLKTDTISELGSEPGTNPTFEKAIMWLYMLFRCKRTANASEEAVYNNAETKISEATVSDDTATYTRNKYRAVT